jgi:hypothetical protein
LHPHSVPGWISMFCWLALKYLLMKQCDVYDQTKLAIHNHCKSMYHDNKWLNNSVLKDLEIQKNFYKVFLNFITTWALFAYFYCCCCCCYVVQGARTSSDSIVTNYRLDHQGVRVWVQVGWRCKTWIFMVQCLLS